jgi:hypothetical protein
VSHGGGNRYPVSDTASKTLATPPIGFISNYCKGVAWRGWHEVRVGCDRTRNPPSKIAHTSFQDESHTVTLSRALWLILVGLERQHGEATNPLIGKTPV